MNPIKSIDPQQVIEQYQEIPYPKLPLNTNPLGLKNVNELFKYSLVNAHYVRNHQILSTEGVTLLNAGCGSGWETLMMAAANPGAEKIVGVDLSPQSVKVAEQRLRLNGYSNVDFYALDILKLDQLGLKFDLITCQDVLYLLDSQVEGFLALKSVLKPHGIISASLHSYHNRRPILEAQEVFQLLGFFEQPLSTRLQRARAWMGNLQPEVQKRFCWEPQAVERDQFLLNNHLLLGDKGFTIAQVMSFLKQAGLGLVSLVDQPLWELERNFTQIPDFVQDQLEDLTQIERWRLTELLNPTSRLIHFWAEQAGASMIFPWSDEEWNEGSVQLNPLLLAQPDFQATFEQKLTTQQPFVLEWIGTPTQQLTLSVEQLSWLQPLFQGPMPVRDLIERVGSSTPQKASQDLAETVITYLMALEEFLFIFLGFD